MNLKHLVAQESKELKKHETYQKDTGASMKDSHLPKLT